MHMAVPTPVHPSPPPPTPFDNHEFFKVCESVSDLQINSLVSFFKIPHAESCLSVGSLTAFSPVRPVFSIV